MDVFKERGVAPPKMGIWTWDEFVEKMKKLTFAGMATGPLIVMGIGFGIQPGTGEAWASFILMAGRFYNDDLTRCVVDSPEFTSGVQKTL